MKIQPITCSQNAVNSKNSKNNINFNASLHVTDAAKNGIFKEIDRLYGGGEFYTKSEVQEIKNRFLRVMKEFKNKIVNESPLSETVIFDSIGRSTPKKSPFLHSHEQPNCEMRIRDKVVDFYYAPGACNESAQVENLYNAFKHLRYISQ